MIEQNDDRGDVGSLERAFEKISVALDEVGRESHNLLLGKLALSLYHYIRDEEVLDQSIRLSKRHIGDDASAEY